MEQNKIRVPINPNSFSITRDDDKCISCGACKSICKFGQGVYGNYDFEKTGEYGICIDCGQCSLVCPTGAISCKNDYIKLREEMKDSNKIFVFQTSPSVRVALGEEFGLEPGTYVEGKMILALRKLGASYVFDTTFGADLTIMEEASELIERLKKGTKLPMFTSCCPAWVRYVEIFFPDYLEKLSTAKSPISMEGTIIKTYFAQKMNYKPKQIINVAVTPCTAKKAEIKREEMHDSDLSNEQIHDMDYVITTRELAQWLKEEQIDFDTLEDSNYDSMFGKGTGAGLIFGNTGGVMEAALRTAYYMITNKNPEKEFLELSQVRGLDGIKEATISISDQELKVAVVTGTKNANKLVQMIKNNEVHYDFIEVMACQGGCIAGGGQPKVDLMTQNEQKEKRIASLYQADKKSNKRHSYENEEVKQLYDEFLQHPLSEQSHQFLHTSYTSKSELLENTVVQ